MLKILLGNYGSQLANLFIALALFGAGMFLLKKPDAIALGSDKSALATLCGALFGSAAIFFGNQISYWFSEASKNRDKLERQKTLRTILTAELVSIFIEHAHQAKLYQILEGGLKDGSIQFSKPFDSTYQVPTPIVFNSLITQFIFLPEKEVDALVNLYDNLSKTRRMIENYSRQETPVMIGLIVAGNLKSAFKNDCDNAADVVDLIAPDRKIKLTNNKLILFSELLRNPQMMA
jgi:hypothetical protein